jgi:hypothetical protein
MKLHPAGKLFEAILYGAPIIGIPKVKNAVEIQTLAIEIPVIVQKASHFCKGMDWCEIRGE